jgi:hypothetical protein
MARKAEQPEIRIRRGTMPNKKKPLTAVAEQPEIRIRLTAVAVVGQSSGSSWFAWLDQPTIPPTHHPTNPPSTIHHLPSTIHHPPALSPLRRLRVQSSSTRGLLSRAKALDGAQVQFKLRPPHNFLPLREALYDAWAGSNCNRGGWE